MLDVNLLVSDIFENNSTNTGNTGNTERYWKIVQEVFINI